MPDIFAGIVKKSDINKKPIIKKKYPVRVLLAQGSLNKPIRLNFLVDHALLIKTSSGQQAIIKKTATFTLNRDKKFTINGKKFVGTSMLFKPLGPIIRFNDCPYQGMFTLKIYRGKWYLINVIELEDYIFSVLRWESWPGWPLEVNKAFAIACRSYAVTRIHAAKKSKKIYHIKNTNTHQTYKGFHIDFSLRKAVKATRGIIMTYNEKPVEAMFDSCCGGLIPGLIHDIDFVKAPYLARMYPCTFCKFDTIFSWLAEYSLEKLNVLLVKHGFGIKGLKDIIIVERDQAGVVKRILLKGATHNLKLTGKQLYSVIPEIKSFAFSINRLADKVQIKGVGYGHHLGICQWGARSMINKGWNYTGILKFYYPGIKFKQIV